MTLTSLLLEEGYFQDNREWTQITTNETCQESTVGFTEK